MKPTFMIIGAAKCASTTLWHRLGQHPDVFMTNPKEPHFFSWDEVYNQGLDWYEKLYEGSEGMTARGEGSVNYTEGTRFPETASRIAAYEPAMKLIYMVRHPLDKLRSHWVQVRSQDSKLLAKKRAAGIIGEEFEQASHSFEDALRIPGVVESANYWEQIERYREHFPDDQILVLFLEDFIADDRAVLRRCFEFLGVDPDIEIPESGRHLNRGDEKTVPRRGFSQLRNLPGIRHAYPIAIGLVPDSIRRAVSERLLRVPAEKPEWTRESRDRVVDALRDNSTRFLEFYGKPADFWSFELSD